jgi:hypothetical protein
MTIPPKSPTAVLIHGLHLQTDDWENVVWGDPLKGAWGSIPRGVEAAWNIQAKRIVWGTGASEKEGVKEAEYMYRFALNHVGDLAQLCNCSSDELRVFLEERSFCDIVTTNTREEVRAFLDLCIHEGVTDVILAPVAQHAPRSIRTVLSLVTSNKEYTPFQHMVSVIPSGTLFKDSNMEHVVIFEKPHRGDRPQNNNHILARRTMDILKAEKGKAFMAEWETLITKYEEVISAEKKA